MTEFSREALYTAYRDKVLAYLKGRTESTEDAEDLCSEVFEKVYKALPQFDPKKASLSTWIFQITRFTFIDYLRKHRQNAPLSEFLQAEDNTEDGLINKENLSRLAKELAALDKETRDIIVLRYYKNVSLTEISRLTGISYGMVKVKHKKALAFLRRRLE